MIEWEVEYTDEFAAWWDTLSSSEHEAIDRDVQVLRLFGPKLGRPRVDHIKGSAYPNMKELRTQHAGEPIRTLFAFDPRRSAILLIGGKKTGDDRWYETYVPLADRLYAEHLDQLRKEGLL